MVGKTKHRTKADGEVIEALTSLGCICCKIMGGFRSAEFHHITDRGRRVGHQYGLPLCEWHHRGLPPAGMTAPLAREQLGPSLAEGKASFESTFGTEAELYGYATGLAGLEHIRD